MNSSSGELCRNARHPTKNTASNGRKCVLSNVGRAYDARVKGPEGNAGQMEALEDAANRGPLMGIAARIHGG